VLVSLAGHRHPEAFVGVDVVIGVLGVLAKVDSPQWILPLNLLVWAV
jgi:hypothetical protein